MKSLLIFVKVVEEERLMMTRHLLTLTPVNLKFICHYTDVSQYHQLLPSLESLVVSIHPNTLKTYYKDRKINFY